MTSNRVGSVFLGDFQRHRLHLPTSAHSTPPSSPPSTTGGSHTGVFSISQSLAAGSEDIDIDISKMDVLGSKGHQSTENADLPRGPGKVDPVLALELRLRWLEALILGIKQDLGKGKGKAREEYTGIAPAHLKPGETLTRLAETVQSKLDKAVIDNEGLKRFMDSYDQNAHLLTPSFALSGILPNAPTYDKMSPEEINAFLAEMEPDIRAADRDMLEIDTLEKKGVTGAGKLSDYEKLEPRLQALLKAHEEDAEFAAELETRISALVDQHATYVDTLSELFVAWDDTLTETEDKLSRMERDKEKRLRLGFE
ncbi:hypothetical protein BDN70DRAFT_884463 [Pholiota conissans]|uniref:Uncharacterized protein n=1 Tax=Pholiota conissans TaxID=109636 RepID=A0A9P5YVP6_9AGAR|nr:hypothetical protein BDN70DRAFT_884463 [Pholiota conissans]